MDDLERLSMQYGVPVLDLDELEIEPAVLKLVSKALAEKYLALPVSRAGRSLVVAVADPSNIEALAELRRTTGCTIEPCVASAESVRDAIARSYR